MENQSSNTMTDTKSTSESGSCGEGIWIRQNLKELKPLCDPDDWRGLPRCQRCKLPPKEHAKSEYDAAVSCDTYGLVNFKSVEKTQKFVRVDAAADMLLMKQLLLAKWKIPKPKWIIAVIGESKKNPNLDRFGKLFEDFLTRSFSTDENVWVTSEGIRTDFLETVGQAVAASNSKNIIPITICGWGKLNYVTRACLKKNQQLPTYGKRKTELNHHSLFHVFSDNGTYTDKPSLQSWLYFRVQLEKLMAQHEQETHSVPYVVLLYGGCSDILDAVKTAIHDNIPIILIKGSGGFADVLSNVLASSEEITTQEQKWTGTVIDETLIMRLTKDSTDANFKANFSEGILCECLQKRELFTVFDHSVHQDRVINPDALFEHIFKALMKCKCTTEVHRWLDYYAPKPRLSNKDPEELLDLQKKEENEKEEMRKKDPEELLELQKKEENEKEEMRKKGLLQIILGLYMEKDKAETVQFILDYRGLSMLEYLQTLKKNHLETMLVIEGGGTQNVLEEMFEWSKNHTQNACAVLSCTQSTGKGIISHDLLQGKRGKREKGFEWIITMVDRNSCSLLFWNIGVKDIDGIKRVKKYRAKRNDLVQELETNFHSSQVKKTQFKFKVTELNENMQEIVTKMFTILRVTGDEAQNNAFEIMFEWASLTSGMDKCALLFWKKGKNLLHSALRASSKKSKSEAIVNMDKPQETRKVFHDAAIGLINTCYKRNPDKSGELIKKQLTNQLQNLVWDEAHREVFGTEAFRTYFKDMWTGKVMHPTSKKGRECNFGQILSPSQKHNIYYVQYMVFLSMFAYTLEIKREPTDTQMRITLAVFWLAFLVEEIRQFWEEPSEMKTFWSIVRDKAKRHFNNWWNILDAACLFFFFLGAIILVAVYNDPTRVDCYTVAIFLFGFDWMLFTIGLLQFFAMYDILAPLLEMIFRMLRDVSPFLLVMLLFIIAEGGAVHFVLNSSCQSTEEMTWEMILDMLFDIFQKPFWNSFGEFFDDIKDSTSESVCPSGYIFGDQTSKVLGKYGVPIYMSMFVILTNLLLMNIIIAKFNNIYQNVEDESKWLAAWNKARVTLEFSNKPALAPPLNLLCLFGYFFLMIKCLISKMNCNKVENGEIKKTITEKDNSEEAQELQHWERCMAEIYLAARENKSRADSKIENLTRLVEGLSKSSSKTTLQNSTEDGTLAELVKRLCKQLETSTKKTEENYSVLAELSKRMTEMESKMRENIKLLKPRTTTDAAEERSCGSDCHISADRTDENM